MSLRCIYVIVWKYEVRGDRVEEFEAIYGSRGQWAELFSLGSGYLGTTLSREAGALLIYHTFDYWRSEEDFRQFSLDFQDAYRALDLQCGLSRSTSSRSEHSGRRKIPMEEYHDF